MQENPGTSDESQNSHGVQKKKTKMRSQVQTAAQQEAHLGVTMKICAILSLYIMTSWNRKNLYPCVLSQICCFVVPALKSGPITVLPSSCLLLAFAFIDCSLGNLIVLCHLEAPIVEMTSVNIYLQMDALWKRYYIKHYKLIVSNLKGSGIFWQTTQVVK